MQKFVFVPFSQVTVFIYVVGGAGPTSPQVHQPRDATHMVPDSKGRGVALDTWFALH